MLVRLLIAVLPALAWSACAPRPPIDPAVPPEPQAPPPVLAAPDTCPARGRAPELLPGVTPRDLELATWTARWGAEADLDEPILTPADVAALNASFAVDPARGLARYDPAVSPADDALLAEINERLGFVRAQVESGAYVGASGAPPPADLVSALAPRTRLTRTESLRTAGAFVQVYCAPSRAGLYAPTLDLRINRNHCSSLRAGDPVRVLASEQGMLLVKAAATTGWIADDAPLSPLTRVPTPRPASPLTRRALLTVAFSMLGTPYGWGDAGGGRDCSRFVMDVFAEFGIELPRFSGLQAQAGSFSIDVSAADTDTKLRVLDAAFARGIVVLHFPGHIMLYLGRDDAGVPKVIHSFAEYITPCAAPEPGGDVETLLEVDRVTVSDLDLGHGTSRTSFLERITRVTVWGGSPGPELLGAAQRRPAGATAPGAGAACAGDENAFLVVSPRVPNTEQPLRVIVTATEDFGSAELAFTDPTGVRHVPPLRRFGGPPFAAVAQVDAPVEGTWTIAFGDGPRVLECETVDVARRRPPRAVGAGPVWPNRHVWSRHYENLYATFIESLFAYPVDQDRTWERLHDLTRSADHNILFDHFGEDEDTALQLDPDCADLPYMLRAYFAWKLGLPFGYRACSRGRAGRPPACSNLQTNLMDREVAGNVDAFQRFSSRSVRNGVQSASGRTAPDDDDTDFYPVALTRRALLPGTLYADPYGHLLLIAGWIPQGLESYGVLLAADSQPDGTIGRPRFWRGAFLFTPDTTDVGAGFKAFRPIRVRDGVAESYTNAELATNPNFAPYALDQYRGTQDAFYGAVEGLINPRPLDPDDVLRSLVDALEAQASRRVSSVANGEEYMRAAGDPTVEMPAGYAIFETVGPWEDYATPSRDMRLLISIDTVRRFAERVRATPEQFGLPAGDPEALRATIEGLGGTLDTELARRTIVYTRSDGTPWTLTLAELVARGAAFEMAYNPNDCVEVRWGAPDGSDERAPCGRRAPRAQLERMETYRAWFVARARPPR